MLNTRSKTVLAVPVIVAIAVTVATAATNPPKSQFTTIDLDDCRIIHRHADGNTWSCEGLAGYPVIYGEGDGRTFMSVGTSPQGAKRKAAEQTLGPFNTIFPANTRRATIEWRIDSGTLSPHATIIRYLTHNDEGRGEVLVIMRVDDKETCHAGIIDALAEPEPMALARQVADSAARTFSCADEPVTYGKTGKSPF